jgi:hypothetical protein
MKTLESFDFTQPSTKRPRSKSYPWGTWFSGEIWELVYGEDFTVDPLLMERMIRTRASPQRLSVNIRHIDEEVNGKTVSKLIFQTKPLDEVPESVPA